MPGEPAREAEPFAGFGREGGYSRAIFGASVDMDSHGQLVVFSVDDRRFALPLSSVQRVVRMVEVTPLPTAPKSVIGVIDVAGRVIPVVSGRGRFGLPDRAPRARDALLIVRSTRSTFAIAVDAVAGVSDAAEEGVTSVKNVCGDGQGTTAVLTSSGGLILIQDADALAPDDASAAGAGLDGAVSTG